MQFLRGEMGFIIVMKGGAIEIEFAPVWLQILPKRLFFGIFCAMYKNRSWGDILLFDRSMKIMTDNLSRKYL